MLILRRHDQQTTFGPRLLDGGAQERVEQPVQDDLARHGLRQLDHGREIKVFDRRSDRARQPGPSLLPLPQLRMEPIELSHLPVGLPAQVAAPGVAQIELLDLLKAAHRIEARRQFISQGFVLNEALVTRRPDGLLVEPFGIQLPAFEAGDLGPHEGGAVLEGFGAVRRPGRKPLMMRRRRFEMQAPLVAGGRVAECGATERLEELIIGPLELGRHRPKRRIARNRREPRGEVLHEGAGLQLADRRYRIGIAMPEVRRAGGIPGANGIQGLILVRLDDRVGEGPVGRHLPAQHPNDGKLLGDAPSDDAKSQPFDDFAVLLRLPRHLAQGGAGRQQIRDQVDATERGEGNIPARLGRVEGATEVATGNMQGLRPVRDMHAEHRIDAGPEALEPRPFHEREADLGQPQTSLVVAEEHALDAAEQYIGQRRAIVVPMLQAERRHPADNELAQGLPAEERRR